MERMSVQEFKDKSTGLTNVDWMQEALQELALCVLELAAIGGMPDSFWYDDSKIAKASVALDWSEVDALTWAKGI